MHLWNIRDIDSKNLPFKNFLEGNSTQNEPESGGLFDKYLAKAERQLIDINSDNKISFDEVQSYINKIGADNKILGKIASILGIEVDGPVNFNMNMTFKANANSILDTLKKVDINKDNDISIEEADNKNLQRSEKIRLNKILGLVDGIINNKQGRYGSCWALTAGYGLSVENKEMFKEVVKRDEQGNAVVTFYGSKDKPFSTKIGRNTIQFLMQKRTQITNYNEINELNGEVDTHKYFSSDPDGIALEMAFSFYDNYLSEEKSKYQKNVMKYIQESEPVQVQKPDVNKLHKGLTQDEWDEFVNYYRNSTAIGKQEYMFSADVKYLTDDMLESMADYISKSQPEKIEKPDLTAGYPSTFELRNYLINSKSETMEKPEFKIYNNHVGTINAGGISCRAISLMVGGDYDVYYGYKFDNEKFEYQELTKAEKEKILSVLQEKNKFSKDKKIYSVSFRNEDKTVRTRHAYNIFAVNEKNVYLIDPHNTDIILSYPINKLLKNLHSLEVNTIPDKLPK